jgi:hypothetical protein
MVVSDFRSLRRELGLQVPFGASVSGGKNPVPNSKRVGVGDRPGCASDSLWLKLICRPGTPLVLVNHFDYVSANAV